MSESKHATDTEGSKTRTEPNFGLAGRRAIVTGHRGGIGSAIFDTLARDDVEVIGLDLHALIDDLVATPKVAER